ncbi:MAG: hypothetical protein NDJ89_14850 [Oligoflexia bacterium]|nr:hypothetical protein [Oligoflexia bacterium]
MKKSVGVLIALSFAGTIYGIGKIYFGDVSDRSYDELPMAELVETQYPWSQFKGSVTKVSRYQETYDLDSNDWIAHFYLEPKEAAVLASRLPVLPSELRLSYRCARSIAKAWAPESICSTLKMEQQGFKAYHYRASLCDAGCKLSVVIWIKPDGDSYIIGSPDYG